MQETAPLVTPPARLLRPLGFGEIFDRAVTLYVRNFWPFSLILLFVMLPYSSAQYSLQARSLAQLGDLMNSATGRGQPTRSRSMEFGGEVVFTLLVVLVLLVPHSRSAPVAMGVARLYRGEPIDVRAATRGRSGASGRSSACSMSI